ncbi:MAG TPA: hypothetical protein VKR43_05355 [Bryobacteraceae bacterium]|nr:hypothetical protein [Bryobacteraceae bacterium]
MNLEDNVLKALQALSESDREHQAPPEMEARLRVAFRRNRAAKRRRQIFGWASAAAVVIVIFTTFAPRPRPASAVPVARPTESAAANSGLGPELGPAPATSPPINLPATPKARARNAVQREIVTDFFPLMDVPPPIGRGALVRVDLPAEAMRTVGLPVREDRLAERVQADVLLSEDGLATAIRFVKVSR